jgi:hypothetical protein
MRPNDVAMKFACWLASRDERIIFGPDDDDVPIIALVGEFCKEYGLLPSMSGELELTANTQPVKDVCLLPQIVSETGQEHEQITEAIYCSAISGGADYKYNMPRTVTLTRQIHNGPTYTKQYVQR